jgi:ParB/RepB/Spo0J family partition protein
MNFEQLHISTIVESPFNYRKTFSPVALQELADSIKHVGIQQPVKVRHLTSDQGDLTGKYELVFGARRFRAAQLAGLEFVPALIDDGLTDELIRVIQLIENIQREDVNVIEEAEGLRELRLAGVPVEQITKETGKKKSHVYATISLTKLAGKARDAAAQGLIDREVAVLLASVPQPLQDKALTLATKTGDDGQLQKLPYRDAKAAIGKQLMIKLENAPFDIEAEGLDGRVSCGDCAHRAGNDEGLSGELDENTCLDTACYRKKVEYHVIVIATAHRAKGGTVLQGQDAKSVNPWHNIYHRHTETSEELLDEPDNTLTIAEGLQKMADAGETPPMPVLLIKEDGTHRQLLADADLLTLQNWMTQQSGAANDDESAQAGEDGATEPRSPLYHKVTPSHFQRTYATPGHRYATDYSHALRRLIRTAALKAERTGEEARWILGTALENNPEIDDDLMQHFGWDAEIEALPPQEQPDESDRGDWIMEHKLQTLSLDDCARIFVYIGLETAPWGYASQDAYADRFIEMATAYGIDVQALAAQQYDKGSAQQASVEDMFDDADEEEEQSTDADQAAD